MASRYDHFRTHRQSRRLAGHDYAAPGWYFVTVCTHGRRHAFGEVRRGVVGLTDAGCIAHACWDAIPAHLPGVVLDAFVVMPNHVHAVIGLTGPPRRPVATGTVATGHAPSLQDGGVPVRDAAPHDGRTPGAEAPPARTTLATVVGSYKSAVTRAVRSTDSTFAWQPRFHDHVIRTDHALSRIRAYIHANPVTWNQDVFHPHATAPSV